MLEQPTIDSRVADEKMNPESFKSEDLFFGSHLYNVSWTAVFKEVTPQLPSARGDFILMVAGTSTVSPLIILTSLIVDNKMNVAIDDVFHQKVKTFAEEILTQYMESSQLGNANANDGPFILLKVLESDYAKREIFLEVYTSLKKQIEKNLNGYDPDHPNVNKNKSQRTKRKWKQPDEEMILPYPMGECWNIG